MRSESESASGQPGPAPFDGIICFGGEDWWYHNRAHYDMQMMRELSAHMPVLYVNSIGMRVPTVTEGGMFWKRVIRKLRSFSRGLVRIRPGFAVQSPIVVPGRRGMAISGWLLPRQIQRAARKLGIRRPLVWVACPPGVAALDHLRPAGIVYQRTDRFEAYEGVDKQLIAGFDAELKERANVVFYCSRHLFGEERDQVSNGEFVDHGVDFDDFVAAGSAADARGAGAPESVRGIPGPRAGFIGDIDSAVFDHELILDVAKRLPDVQIVLVGGCTLPEGWSSECPNLHLTGRIPYEEVAATMAAMDVLLMPWHRSEWIEACNPIKLKEYLATGRPIVSTDFPELRHYGGLLDIENEAGPFAAAIQRGIDDPDEARLARGRAHVATASWTSRAETALGLIRDSLESR